MTRRKRLFLLILALLVLAGAVFALWYTRPQSLEALCSELELELSDCDAIQARGSIHTGQARSVPFSFTLASDDPGFSALLAAFQDRSFSRSLASLLPRGTWYHAAQPGEFEWELIFQFDDPVLLPSGDTAVGALLSVHNFYGRVELSCGQQTLRISTRNLDAWLTEVMELLNAAAPSGTSSETAK